MRRFYVVWVIVSAAILYSGSQVSEGESADLSLDDAAKLVITETDTNGQTNYFLNVELWDQKNEAAWQRAAFYPPAFANEQEHQQVAALVRYFVKAVEGLKVRFESSSAMAERAANVYRMAYNLDLNDLQPGAKARYYYEWALKQRSENARLHWLYGSFLCSAADSGAGLPHLERARDLGSTEALYDLGLFYSDRDPQQAIGYLEQYVKFHPSDNRGPQLLKALRSGARVDSVVDQNK